MDQHIDIQINLQSLQPSACLDFVSTPNSGGINIFIGTVRNVTAEKPVIRLEFEGYEPMAVSEMKKICLGMMDKWPINRISMHHRLGKLEIGEIAVIIAVAAGHRDAAFKACRFAIDTLKKTVPIWKKEIFSDGEIWVAAHP